jgi:hypothetical protein
MRWSRAIFLFTLITLLAGCSGDKSKAVSTPVQPNPTPTPSPTPAPTPSPSPPATVTLTGFVRESAPTDTIPVANARVEIVDATPNAFTGFVLTDSSGFYQFPGLSSSISFRASKEGYEGDPQRTHLISTQTQDFNITPLSRIIPTRETILIGQSRTGAVSPMDNTCGGMYFRLSCKRFASIVNSAESIRARLNWPSRHDLDLELWRDDRLVARSTTCQACGVGTSEETFTTTIEPGDYEFRVGYFLDNDGLTASFELNVVRPN